MSELTALAKYYKNLGITPRFSAARYFAALRKYLRCPICHQDAKVAGEFFLCSRCHRGWKLAELLYPDLYSAPVLSSLPASGVTAPQSEFAWLLPGYEPHVMLPGSSNLTILSGKGAAG